MIIEWGINKAAENGVNISATEMTYNLDKITHGDVFIGSSGRLKGSIRVTGNAKFVGKIEVGGLNITVPNGARFNLTNSGLLPRDIPYYNHSSAHLLNTIYINNKFYL